MFEISKYLYQSNIFIYICPIILLFLLKTPKLFFCLIVFFDFIRMNERFELPYTLSAITIPLMIICYYLNISDGYKNNFKKEDKILFIYVIYILLQTICVYRYNLKPVIILCILGIFNYFCVLMFLSDKKGLILLLFTIVFTISVICFESLYYHHFESVDSALWLRFHGPTLRLIAWGFWANANEVSFLSCIAIASSLLLLSILRKNLFLILLFSIIIMLFFYTILLTASRAGIMSLIIIFVGFIFFVKSKFLRFIIIILMISGLVIAPKFITKRTDQDASSSERYDLRWMGRQLFIQNPIFGIGFLRSKEETGGMALHSTYVQAFSETGILGGTLFFYYLFLVATRLYRIYLISKIYKEFQLGFGIIAGFFMSCVFYLYFGNQLLTKIFFISMAIIKIACFYFENHENLKNSSIFINHQSTQK